MADLNRTMFYQTSFEVESVAGDDVLWNLLMVIRDWLGYKARRDGYSFPLGSSEWTRLKNGSELRSDDADVRIVSKLHIDDGSYTWAGRLDEDKDLGDGTAPRRWTSEIGFAGTSLSSGCFSLLLSYGDQPGFLGRLQPRPMSTVPLVVSDLLDSDKLRCTRSGIDLSQGVFNLCENDIDWASNFILNSSRSIPVVLYAASDKLNWLVEPNEILKELGPNAVVLVAGPSVSPGLNKLLRPYEYSCLSGSVRVYMAYPEPAKTDGDGCAHRFFTTSAIQLIGVDTFLSMLRRALAQDFAFRQKRVRINDVLRMNWRSSNERRILELRERHKRESLEMEGRLQAKQEELLGQVEARSKEEIDRVENDYLQLLDENDELKRTIDDLAKKAAAFSYHSYQSRPLDDCACERELRSLLNSKDLKPVSPMAAVKLAMAAYPGRIDLSDRGWGSLDSCKTSPDVVRDVLVDICEILQPLYAANGANVKSEFESQSRFGLALTEGKATRDNPDLMGTRRDFYKGREISIEPHVKSKVSKDTDSRFIRVYYAWDKSSGLIVIGSLGKHLPSAATRHIH